MAVPKLRLRGNPEWPAAFRILLGTRPPGDEVEWLRGLTTKQVCRFIAISRHLDLDERPDILERYAYARNLWDLVCSDPVMRDWWSSPSAWNPSKQWPRIGKDQKTIKQRLEFKMDPYELANMITPPDLRDNVPFLILQAITQGITKAQLHDMGVRFDDKKTFIAAAEAINSSRYLQFRMGLPHVFFRGGLPLNGYSIMDKMERGQQLLKDPWAATQEEVDGSLAHQQWMKARKAARAERKRKKYSRRMHKSHAYYRPRITFSRMAGHSRWEAWGARRWRRS